jgi:hypothetical protein
MEKLANKFDSSRCDPSQHGGVTEDFSERLEKGLMSK